MLWKANMCTEYMYMYVYIQGYEREENIKKEGRNKSIKILPMKAQGGW